MQGKLAEMRLEEIKGLEVWLGADLPSDSRGRIIGFAAFQDR